MRHWTTAILVGSSLLTVFEFGCRRGLRLSERMPVTENENTSFCGQLDANKRDCPEDECQSAFLNACSQIESVLGAGYLDGVRTCLGDAGAPTGCFIDAVDMASSNLTAFAQTYCSACEGEDDCQSEVESGEGDSDAAVAGRLARLVNSDLLSSITSACLHESSSCGRAFPNCVLHILEGSLASAAAKCTVDAGTGKLADTCEGADTDGDTGDDGSTGSGGGDESGTDSGDDGSCETACGCLLDTDCQPGFVCVENTCVTAAACVPDEHEPSDGEDQAKQLGTIDDNDGSGGTVSGELAGAGDADWFVFEGHDTTFATVDPTAGANVYDLQVCVYVECLNGLSNTQVKKCPMGTSAEPSAGGRPGCCGSQLSELELEIGCGDAPLGFASDSAKVYVRVAGNPADICQPYTLKYHF